MLAYVSCIGVSFLGHGPWEKTLSTRWKVHREAYSLASAMPNQGIAGVQVLIKKGMTDIKVNKNKIIKFFELSFKNTPVTRFSPKSMIELSNIISSKVKYIKM